MTTEKKDARDKEIKARMKKIRAAVGQIVESSGDWANEVCQALSGCDEKKRIDFIRWAGAACGVLGDYIAAAGAGAQA